MAVHAGETTSRKIDDRQNRITGLSRRAIMVSASAPRRTSKNQLTLAHLNMACRHVKELMAAGVTENLAIRTLELFCDVYAKLLMGGSATPHHVNQVPRAQWSLAALEAIKQKPFSRVGDYLRVEHGTPRRAFALLVFDLYRKSRLTERRLKSLVHKSWKLAVVTLEEDLALNRIARSKSYACPDDRWRAAGIKFAGTGRTPR